MATLRLFAGIRDAAGTGTARVEGSTVGEVVAAAEERFGSEFAGMVQVCRIWRNGEPVGLDARVGDDDEVALLPPVSGGGDPDGGQETMRVASMPASRWPAMSQ